LTLLVSWIGLDNKKDGPRPSSFYIASDSRITWGDSAKFDYGKKIFGCKNSPDIFGYCGDSLFPSIILSQITDMIDLGLLFTSEMSCKEKAQVVIDRFIHSFKKYPSQVEGITTDSLQIIHATRDEKNDFYTQKMSWLKETNKWTSESMLLKDHSSKVFAVGSGGPEFLEKLAIYEASSYGRTSRAVFHCFCDTLSNIRVKSCGGAPQLAGLYRKFNGQFYGVINKRKRYFSGLQIEKNHNLDVLEWRNELFEICNPKSMKIKLGAKRRPNLIK